MGITPVPSDPAATPWLQAAGPTVFAPFAADNDYFGRDTQQWMLNFRVRDLATLIAELEAAGIEIGRRDEMAGVGSFARIHDPEGNPIELWQPASD